jgi:hypothetical protein
MDMDPAANTTKSIKAGLDVTGAGAISAGIALATLGNHTTGLIVFALGAACFAIKRFLL